MSDPTAAPAADETQVITVRYWASARSAAGVDTDQLSVTGPIPLTEVLSRVVGLHAGSRLNEVLQVCSVLVGDRPVSSEEPGDVQVAPGSSVEFLPPFAGG